MMLLNTHVLELYGKSKAWVNSESEGLNWELFDAVFSELYGSLVLYARLRRLCRPG